MLPTSHKWWRGGDCGEQWIYGCTHYQWSHMVPEQPTTGKESRLFFLRRLKRARRRTKLLVNIDRSTREHILYQCVAVAWQLLSSQQERAVLRGHDNAEDCGSYTPRPACCVCWLPQMESQQHKRLDTPGSPPVYTLSLEEDIPEHWNSGTD